MGRLAIRIASKRFSVPRAILSIASTGCSNDNPTDVWPARLYISVGSNLRTTCKTLRKSFGAIDTHWIRSSIPSDMSPLMSVDDASRDVPTTS